MLDSNVTDASEEEGSRTRFFSLEEQEKRLLSDREAYTISSTPDKGEDNHNPASRLHSPQVIYTCCFLYDILCC